MKTRLINLNKNTIKNIDWYKASKKHIFITINPNDWDYVKYTLPAPIAALEKIIESEEAIQKVKNILDYYDVNEFENDEEVLDSIMALSDRCLKDNLDLRLLIGYNHIDKNFVVSEIFVDLSTNEFYDIIAKDDVKSDYVWMASTYEIF